MSDVYATAERKEMCTKLGKALAQAKIKYDRRQELLDSAREAEVASDLVEGLTEETSEAFLVFSRLEHQYDKRCRYIEEV